MRRCLVWIPWLLGACAEWPRAANIPKPVQAEPADVDPGDLVDIQWEDRTESADPNELPTDLGAGPLPLGRGVGLLIRGTLDGIGWGDAITPEPIVDDNCPGVEGTRSPLPVGDYIADVDFVVVDLERRGTLCASVRVDANSVGWDLVPFEANPCGIPLGLLTTSKGKQVGVDLGGSGGGWGVNVEAGDRVAIGFAGYNPNDPEMQVDYSLALSLVAATRKGPEGVCPNHPEGDP